MNQRQLQLYLLNLHYKQNLNSLVICRITFKGTKIQKNELTNQTHNSKVSFV